MTPGKKGQIFLKSGHILSKDRHALLQFTFFVWVSELYCPKTDAHYYNSQLSSSLASHDDRNLQSWSDEGRLCIDDDRRF